MKTLQINIIRSLGCLIATFLVTFTALPRASAQWTVTNLHPSGAAGSRAYTVHDGKQAGFAIFGGARHACTWTGSAATFRDIHPAWAGATGSEVNATAGGQQVGNATFGSPPSHASLWSSTSESWVDLTPVGADGSYAFGIDGGQQAGYIVSGGSTFAAMWSGSAGTYGDLHPGWTGATASRALDADAGQQSGYVLTNGLEHACLWYGTADSFLELHPPGADSSVAHGAGGGQQVGLARVGGAIHASLWTGSTASWIDLNPAGGSNSEAYDADAGEQVGYVTVNGVMRASTWAGSSASWTDLNRFLPKGYSYSIAFGIWHDSRYTYVVGMAYNTKAKREEAVMWRKRR